MWNLVLHFNFRKEYEDIFKNTEYKEKFVECVRIKIEKEEVDVYLMKLIPPYHFDGFTRYFQ